MSGSGSRGRTPTVPSSPCERLTFRATINSPQPAIIGRLTVGDILLVQLQTTPTPAVVVLHNGAIAGALTGPKVNELVKCIQNGFQYQAEVMALQGGSCTVDVGHV